MHRCCCLFSPNESHLRFEYTFVKPKTFTWCKNSVSFDSLGKLWSSNTANPVLVKPSDVVQAYYKDAPNKAITRTVLGMSQWMETLGLTLDLLERLTSQPTATTNPHGIAENEWMKTNKKEIKIKITEPLPVHLEVHFLSDFE